MLLFRAKTQLALPLSLLRFEKKSSLLSLLLLDGLVEMCPQKFISYFYHKPRKPATTFDGM